MMPGTDHCPASVSSEFSRVIVPFMQESAVNQKAEKSLLKHIIFH
jgi:hypothetical protein